MSAKRKSPPPQRLADWTNLAEIRNPVLRALARMVVTAVAPLFAFPFAVMFPLEVWRQTSPKRLAPTPAAKPPRPDVIVVRADELRPGDVLVKSLNGGLAATLDVIRLPPQPDGVVVKTDASSTKSKVDIVHVTYRGPGRVSATFDLDLFAETPVVIHARPEDPPC